MNELMILTQMIKNGDIAGSSGSQTINCDSICNMCMAILEQRNYNGYIYDSDHNKYIFRVLDKQQDPVVSTDSELYQLFENIFQEQSVSPDKRVVTTIQPAVFEIPAVLDNFSVQYYYDRSGQITGVQNVVCRIHFMCSNDATGIIGTIEGLLIYAHVATEESMDLVFTLDTNYGALSIDYNPPAM